MRLEQIKRQKPKSEYPVLERALSGNPEDFNLLQKAYSPDEMYEFEERMNTRWDPTLIPQLLTKVKKGKDGMDQKMAA